MVKPELDLTDEKAGKYRCPKCNSVLTHHALAPKQPLRLSMYCVNDDCPIKKIKIFTIG